MMDEIVNRVQESGIVSINFEEAVGHIPIESLDLAPYLWQGLVLRETEFRDWAKSHDWNQYHGQAVAVFCSADAIIPMWAYMLVASHLEGRCRLSTFGSAEDVREQLLLEYINNLDLATIRDQRLVVKGCSSFNVRPTIFMHLTQRFQPHVKSLMFGEPCSTVPIYKVPRKG